MSSSAEDDNPSLEICTPLLALSALQKLDLVLQEGMTLQVDTLIVLLKSFPNLETLSIPSWYKYHIDLGALVEIVAVAPNIKVLNLS